MLSAGDRRALSAHRCALELHLALGVLRIAGERAIGVVFLRFRVQRFALLLRFRGELSVLLFRGRALLLFSLRRCSCLLLGERRDAGGLARELVCLVDQLPPLGRLLRDGYPGVCDRLS